ncbi:hypothetical protein CYMTET_24150 [Cymbomonas tetramitiformis]|uniref:Uncharacterized protein n=1 Tax=Cymbomonas tetramitiformis TaxID=36881 RepID=A0AAE0FWF7_9CHLO|nr:hypothetical protein CYMTET_24150 [Cymbomonas tetramitiformis]
MPNKRKSEEDRPYVATARKAVSLSCELFGIERKTVQAWCGRPICEMTKDQLKTFLQKTDYSRLTEQRETAYTVVSDLLRLSVEHCKQLVQYNAPAPSKSTRQGGGGGSYKLDAAALQSYKDDSDTFGETFEKSKKDFKEILACPYAHAPTHNALTVAPDETPESSSAACINQVAQHQGADQTLVRASAELSASLHPPSRAQGSYLAQMNQVREHQGADQSLVRASADPSAVLHQQSGRRYLMPEASRSELTQEELLGYCKHLEMYVKETSSTNDMLTNDKNILTYTNNELAYTNNELTNTNNELTNNINEVMNTNNRLENTIMQLESNIKVLALENFKLKGAEASRVEMERKTFLSEAARFDEPLSPSDDFDNRFLDSTINPGSPF